MAQADDPFDPRHLDDPYPFYAHLRAQPSDLVEVPERGVFVAARHDVARSVLRDHTTYRSGLGVQWMPVEEAGLRTTFIENDPPAHTRVRRAAQKWCTPGAITGMARSEWLGLDLPDAAATWADASFRLGARTRGGRGDPALRRTRPLLSPAHRRRALGRSALRIRQPRRTGLRGAPPVPHRARCLGPLGVRFGHPPLPGSAIGAARGGVGLPRTGRGVASVEVLPGAQRTDSAAIRGFAHLPVRITARWARTGGLFSRYAPGVPGFHGGAKRRSENHDRSPETVDRAHPRHRTERFRTVGPRGRRHPRKGGRQRPRRHDRHVDARVGVAECSRRSGHGLPTAVRSDRRSIRRSAPLTAWPMLVRLENCASRRAATRIVHDEGGSQWL
jgi:hypothetical protein